MAENRHYLNVKFLGNRLTSVDTSKELTFDDIIRSIKNVVYVIDPDTWDIYYTDDHNESIPLTRSTDMSRFQSLLKEKRVVEVTVNPNLNRCYEKVIDFFSSEKDKGGFDCKIS
jgi:hypothetical protein